MGDQTVEVDKYYNESGALVTNISGRDISGPWDIANVRLYENRDGTNKLVLSELDNTVILQNDKATGDVLDNTSLGKSENTHVYKTLMAEVGISQRYEVRCDMVGSVTVIPDVAESVLRHEVQGFAQRHPELVSEMREIKATVGTFNGQPATLDTLLTTPSHFRACPADRKDDGIVVEKLAR